MYRQIIILHGFQIDSCSILCCFNNTILGTKTTQYWAQCQTKNWPQNKGINVKKEQCRTRLRLRRDPYFHLLNYSATHTQRLHCRKLNRLRGNHVFYSVVQPTGRSNECRKTLHAALSAACESSSNCRLLLEFSSVSNQYWFSFSYLFSSYLHAFSKLAWYAVDYPKTKNSNPRLLEPRAHSKQNCFPVDFFHTITVFLLSLTQNLDNSITFALRLFSI